MKKNLTICIYGTYDRSYTSNKLILQGLKENNINVVEVNAQIPVTRLDKAEDMNWFEIIRRVVNKYRIIPVSIMNWKKIASSDVIYVGYPGHFDVFFAYAVAKFFGKKLVFNPLLVIYIGFAEEQGILSKNSLLGKAVKFFEQLAYHACDLVFADTPFQQVFFEKDYAMPREKLRVLAIGADDKYYRFTPYTNTKKKINVVYYGLYSPIHGVEYIINAAIRLKNDPDIHFTMVGNGNTFEKNYNLAKKNKLKNISFYHDTPLDQHPAIIQQGDIFLGFLTNTPTVKRVIPNKVYQGLALNKVVLTANAPVTQSMFKHKENMYLVKPESTEALVEALVELKNNPKLRKTIAENGYMLFTKKFSPKAVGEQLIDYIKEIV